MPLDNPSAHFARCREHPRVIPVSFFGGCRLQQLFDFGSINEGCALFIRQLDNVLEIVLEPSPEIKCVARLCEPEARSALCNIHQFQV
jgi:hypothetical protein